MTKAEFLPVMAYIAAAIGKPFAPEAAAVYFDLLGDLPLDVLRVTAKRVVLEHKWSSFPTVAELREAAAETMRGEVKELSPAEAWKIAWAVAGDTDPEVDGSFVRACKKASAPPIVIEAIKTFGLNALCYGKEPVGVIRGQFLKVVEQLQARDRRHALLPAPVKQEVRAIGSQRRALTAPVAEAVARIECEKPNKETNQ
jgi:hypothetical protein